MPNVAILHDALTLEGGAERVAIELARTYNAPIYATKVDDDSVPDDVDAHQVFDGRWSRFFMNQGWKRHTMYWIGRHLYTMQRATYIPELHEYDVVIQSKGALRWYVPREDQTVIWYLHSTPRRHYDLFHRYGDAALSRFWSLFFRFLEQHVTNYPTMVATNSETTAQRARQYWGIDDDRLDVCYPPAPTEGYEPGAVPTGQYYLSLGRLAHNKGTTEIVEAANELEIPLVVAGDGSRREQVEAAAGENVEVLGHVSEARKRELMAGAKAFLFNAEQEDFGMAPVEAMAAGTPVIGVDEGFTQHQIIDGRNGLLFERGHLLHGIRRFEAGGVQWSAERISHWSKANFGRQQFREQIRSIVDQAQRDNAIEPGFAEPAPVEVTIGDD